MHRKIKKQITKKRAAILILLVFCFAPLFQAWGMQSSNYRIDQDSINFGGTDDSSSANYRLSDTMGEIGTGEMDTGCSSLSFDGGDLVTAPDDDTLDLSSTMTISAWLYPTSEYVGYASHPIKKMTSTTSANHSLYYFGTTSGENGIIRFYATRGGTWGSISGSYTTSLNNWYHVVLSFDSSLGGQLYINGNSVGSRTGVGSLSINTDDFVVGEGFPGVIDEVSIYSRAISGTEVSDLYQGKHISDTGLVSRWNFNERSGNVAYDATSNDNDGSISGAAFSINYPSSTCNTISAGYRQADASYTISISSPSDVTMSPNIGGLSGGTGNGSAAWTVITDNPAGYEASIKSSTSPAMQSGAYSFANYTTSVVGTPDYNWSVASADSEFGFTVEGSYVVGKFLDNGSSACATGSSNTVDKCWYPFAVSDETVVSSSSANSPGGTATTVKFRAESGSGHFQQEGSYAATITVTAVAL